MSNTINKPPIIQLQNVSKRFVKSLDLSEKIARKLGVNIREEVVHAVDHVNLVIKQRFLAVIRCGEAPDDVRRYPLQRDQQLANGRL